MKAKFGTAYYIAPDSLFFSLKISKNSKIKKLNNMH